jgi:hypothetical protein
MANGQTINENNKVSPVFQWVVGVSVAVTASMVLWAANTLNKLNIQVTLLNNNYEHNQFEHAKFDSRITRLEERDRRERSQRRSSNDN